MISSIVDGNNYKLQSLKYPSFYSRPAAILFYYKHWPLIDIVSALTRLSAWRSPSLCSCSLQSPPWGSSYVTNPPSASLPGLQRDISKIRSGVSHSRHTPQRLSPPPLSLTCCPSPSSDVPPPQNSPQPLLCSHPQPQYFPAVECPLPGPCFLWCALGEKRFTFPGKCLGQFPGVKTCLLVRGTQSATS